MQKLSNVGSRWPIIDLYISCWIICYIDLFIICICFIYLWFFMQWLWLFQSWKTTKLPATHKSLNSIWHECDLVSCPLKWFNSVKDNFLYINLQYRWPLSTMENYELWLTCVECVDCHLNPIQVQLPHWQPFLLHNLLANSVLEASKLCWPHLSWNHRPLISCPSGINTFRGESCLLVGRAYVSEW